MYENGSLSDMARDLLLDLWRSRIVILLSMLLGLLIAYGVLQMMTPIYKSKTSLLFDFNRQAVISGLPADAIAPTEAVLNSEIEVLTSRSFISAVVDDLHLIDDPEFNPWAQDADGKMQSDDPAPPEQAMKNIVVDNLFDHVAIKLIPDSYVFEIRSQSMAPDKAANIANSMADVFIMQRQDRGQATANDASLWLGERVSELRQQTLEAERQMNAQRMNAPRNGDVVLDSLIVQIETLRERILDLEGQYQGIEGTVKILSDQLDVENIDGAAAYIENLRSDPTASADLVDLARGTDITDTASLQVVVQRLEAAARKKRAAVNELETDLQALRDDYARVSDSWLTLKDLERTVLANQANYAALLEKQRAGANGPELIPFLPDVQVISKAVPATKPAHPQKKLTMALGGLAGIAMGVIFAIGWAAVHPVVRSNRDLRKVPGVYYAGRLAMRRNQQPDGLLQNAQSGASPLGRSIRKLAITLAANVKPQSGKIYLFAALQDQKLGTVVAHLFAQNVVSTGNRALILEVDPNSGSILPDSPVVPSGDLSAVTQAAIQTHPVSKVDVLRLAFDGDRGDLLRVIEQRSKHPVFANYEVILLATPPLEESPLGYLLGVATDLPVLVLSEGTAGREGLQRVMDIFAQNAIWRVASVLVNSRG